MKINLKKNKGQIMVLDVLLATVLLVFLFLILSKMAEVKIYERISDSRAEELEMVGSLVYDRLVNNPKINCYIFDGHTNYVLRSCFSTESEIRKNYLGIPDGYECSISFSEGFSTMEISGQQYCLESTPNEVNEYFEIQQKCFTMDSSSRQIIYGAYTELPVKIINLKVWRNE